MTESYFKIKFEFDIEEIWNSIRLRAKQNNPGYVCVADGNVLSHVQRNPDYENVVNSSMFSICDSGWVPVYLNWIYGIHREQYCGPAIFKDLIQQGRLRMFFMGVNQFTLDKLKANLIEWNPEVADMTFYALPYRDVKDFDYKSIAEKVNADDADVIWVALGAPKQDYFMHYLQPYLKRGVMIGVGAAFNFYSGFGERRAPDWMVKSHMEFIYRIFQSPKKQLLRCSQIITTMPKMLAQEIHRKKNRK